MKLHHRNLVSKINLKRTLHVWIELFGEKSTSIRILAEFASNLTYQWDKRLDSDPIHIY